MKNIILTGMPGVGKSTVGVMLAKFMGMRFLDTDLVIQNITDRLLYEIIEEKGIEGFICLENETNKKISAKNTVIATGGSAVYGKEAMEHFKEVGKIVYLKLSCESLLERLGDIGRRGVAIKEGQSFEELYNERIPLYEKYADIIVNCEGKNIFRIAREIEYDIKSGFSIFKH